MKQEGPTKVGVRDEVENCMKKGSIKTIGIQEASANKNTRETIHTTTFSLIRRKLKKSLKRN